MRMSIGQALGIVTAGDRRRAAERAGRRAGMKKGMARGLEKGMANRNVQETKLSMPKGLSSFVLKRCPRN